MIQSRVSSGYIFILTLMITSLSVVTVTYITNRALAFMPYARATADREKALQLALSGVQCALSQLAGSPEKAPPKPSNPEAEKTKAASSPDKNAIALLKTLLPVKNRWQTFTLTKSRDGIAGSLNVCIMCEQGKLNINELYDFEKQKFIGEKETDSKQFLQTVFTHIEQLTGGKDLFSAFEKFLKQRQYKLYDVTELLTIKEFEIFKNLVVYEPLEGKKETDAQQKNPLYLTDIFTVWSESSKLEPWLLSESLCALFGFKTARGEQQAQKEQVDQVLKQVKLPITWKNDWNKFLAPFYGKEFGALPKGLDQYLSSTCDPAIFSVLSYGKVGKMTQKVLAIIERTKPSSSEDEGLFTVTIRKLYWL